MNYYGIKLKDPKLFQKPTEMSRLRRFGRVLTMPEYRIMLKILCSF